MLRNFLAAALTTTILATAPAAFAETMVKEVVVKADLTAIENAKAGTHWATLTDDLQNAIVTRVASRAAEEGVKITVEIDSVELANSFQSSLGVADSKLSGQVRVTSDIADDSVGNYDVAVSFEQAGPFFVAGTDLSKITTDSKEYYDAMIVAFADYVAAQLK